MKRIIAAALSILVGAFGYNIVDKALEDRVATLESEVVELQDEVSKYHPEHYNVTTWVDIYEGSEVYTTEEQYDTTTQTEGSTGIQVGDYLYETSGSIRKFLIREYSDGVLEYIDSRYYEPVSFGQKVSYATETRVQATISRPYDDVDDGFETTTCVQTTYRYPTNEYFVYLTDVTAQWIEAEEIVSYQYSYDKDYSQVSKKFVTGKNYITVKYTGYTDPQLAGTKIDFGFYGYGDFDRIGVSNNIIDSNGCFEFEVRYFTCSYPNSFYVRNVALK